jgi:hypothetical protein
MFETQTVSTAPAPSPTTPAVAPSAEAPEGILVDTVIADITAKVVASVGKTQAAALAPIIAQYGPVFAKMTADEIWSWIATAVRGDAFKAYSALITKLDNQALVDEWSNINTKWQALNTANAASVAWQRDAINALLKALVTIAASLVVL